MAERYRCGKCSDKSSSLAKSCSFTWSYRSNLGNSRKCGGNPWSNNTHARMATTTTTTTTIWWHLVAWFIRGFDVILIHLDLDDFRCRFILWWLSHPPTLAAIGSHHYLQSNPELNLLGTFLKPFTNTKRDPTLPSLPTSNPSSNPARPCRPNVQGFWDCS